MEKKSRRPFECIESAQEYLGLLSETVIEALEDTQADIDAQAGGQSVRHTEALRMVSYNLEKLDRHLKLSRRLLNDLRTLRRLLHGERMGRLAAQHKRVV